MDEIFKIVSSTVFLNNAILLGFLLIFTVLFAWESHDPKSHIDWIDLIVDPKTKKVSVTKMGQFIGLAASTWIVITLSQIKEAYAIFPMIFPMWLAFIGGTWSYQQWLKSKEAGKYNPTNQQTDNSSVEPQETEITVTNKKVGTDSDSDGYVTK